MLDHGRILGLCQALEDDPALAGVLRQLADIQGFLRRESEAPHLVRPQFQNARGGQRRLSRGGVQPRENNTGYPPAQLLVHNRADERFKGRLAILDGKGAHPLNDAGQYRVRFPEMFESGAHMERSR